MTFYDSLDLAMWQTLTDTQKISLFETVLKLYVNPRLVVECQQLVTFQMCGMSCRTVELTLGGEEFVFVPGQKEVILGWDLGSEGLKSHELLGYQRPDFKQSEQKFKTDLTLNDLKSWQKPENKYWPTYDFSSLTEIGLYINQFTSPLRQVTVSPMIVAKQAKPVGSKLRGYYQLVSGDFSGDGTFLEKYQLAIEASLKPRLTLAESLVWDYPQSLFKANNYYLEQSLTEDRYGLYELRTVTYGELWLQLYQEGFQLLDEDAWEYAVGGGARRLFRWGNQLGNQKGQTTNLIPQEAAEVNQFGLSVNSTSQFYEVTDTNRILKLGLKESEQGHLIENLLPLATYFNSGKYIAPDEPLNGEVFYYRKAIMIKPT